MHDTCSGRLHIKLGFLATLSVIKKQEAALDVVRSVSHAAVTDRLTNSRVESGQ